MEKGIGLDRAPPRGRTQGAVGCQEESRRELALKVTEIKNYLRCEDAATHPCILSRETRWEVVGMRQEK